MLQACQRVSRFYISLESNVEYEVSVTQDKYLSVRDELVSLLDRRFIERRNSRLSRSGYVIFHRLVRALEAVACLALVAFCVYLFFVTEAYSWYAVVQIFLLLLVFSGLALWFFIVIDVEATKRGCSKFCVSQLTG